MSTADGQRVWITGASSGIGEALAYAFHRAGARLILSARRADQLSRVQSLCGGEASARVLPLDVTQTTELPDKARAALQMFGGIDILVNNAGLTQRSLVKDTELDVYRKLMEVNFFGAIALTKAVLPAMMEANGSSRSTKRSRTASRRSYGGNESWSVWFSRSSAVGGRVMMLGGMTSPDGPSAPSGFQVLRKAERRNTSVL